jgi:hypothetical protein
MCVGAYNYVCGSVYLCGVNVCGYVCASACVWVCVCT